MHVFDIDIEFDRQVLHHVIEECVRSDHKGYVCFVDANVLSIARKDAGYLRILQDAMVISCDGGSIAAMVNRIHHTDVRAYNGPDLFEHYIGQGQFRQLLLGSTEEKFHQIEQELVRRGLPTTHISHLPVPFARVEDFDYEAIAAQINAATPDLVWVSLGAPKQERFMSRLLPFINRGVLLGVGAALNFYVGDNVQPKVHLGALRFIWLDRIYREPRKQLKRVWMILLTLPRLYRDEMKRKRRNQR